MRLGNKMINVIKALILMFFTGFLPLILVVNIKHPDHILTGILMGMSIMTGIACLIYLESDYL